MQKKIYDITFDAVGFLIVRVTSSFTAFVNVLYILFNNKPKKRDAFCYVHP